MTRGIAAAAALIAVVTVGARLAGFARTVVFSQTVGDTCLGTAYVTANQLPAVLFEIVIGGALTVMVVPVLAVAVRRGEHERVRRTVSALITWVLLLSLPLAALLALVSVPAMTLMLGGGVGCGRAALISLAARMLVVFAPQVVFYGLAAVLFGVLQAHRRFLGPALAPLVSSLVVVAAYLAFVPLGSDHRQEPGALPSVAELTLSLGTTAGVAALFVTALLPTRRLGLSLRPRLTFPPGVGARVRYLATASLLPLVAMQSSLLLAVALANRGGGAGAAVHYTYAWALFTLPYGVIAVPIATSAFTELAVAHAEHDRPGFARLSAAGARAVVVITAAAGTALAAAAGPLSVVLARVDPLPLERGLLAYAPGVVGFALIAVTGRALYASHDGRRAAIAQVVGWSVVMVCSCALVWAVPAGWAITGLGAATTVGTGTAAVLLCAGVVSVHGRDSLAGLSRSLAAALLGGVAGTVAGRAVAVVSEPSGVQTAVGAVLVSGGAALVVFGAVAALVDRSAVRVVAGRAQAVLERRRGTR
ncbi:murein biosynthesis integral membrane protein MurJ [Nocardiopsis sp. JB363]|uniref:murein biosynthesis integral membrane protein MurJ n=1 Tax=Nocardiopsis sp. JB363 TaxID=1434837 RepID=UPI00097A36EF|nr:lipid II flippase MurJ [Nocardiopsis sp. JB363]SIO85972.1 Proposed peptidoglycan lipid II flippase MurJ [Nocardiopsis sp. JB363]